MRNQEIKSIHQRLDKVEDKIDKILNNELVHLKVDIADVKSDVRGFSERFEERTNNQNKIIWSIFITAGLSFVSIAVSIILNYYLRK